ncbi:MAG: SymE family type I addiction module toxin [Acidobacteriota bacterium]
MVPAGAGRKCRRPRGCEIVLRADLDLYRGPREVLTILLHRLVHLANGLSGCRDSTHSGYHNQHFKKLAETVGFRVAKRHSRFGWGITEATPGLLDFFDALAPDAVIFERRGDPPALLWSCGVTPLPLQDAVESGVADPPPEGCLTIVPKPSQWCAPKRCGVAREIPSFGSFSIGDESALFDEPPLHRSASRVDGETVPPQKAGAVGGIAEESGNSREGALGPPGDAPSQQRESVDLEQDESLPIEGAETAPRASNRPQPGDYSIAPRRTFTASEGPLPYLNGDASDRSSQELLMELRSLEVQGLWRPGEPVPLLRLAGRWLDEAGFTIGCAVAIEVEKHRLVIRRRR